ncbi:hypothetical protein DFP73DRAFT_588749 [Morchella snyderi]|nr:hypothetical protein DFP73DRAFT_588749 [Morchella snyderi]
MKVVTGRPVLLINAGVNQTALKATSPLALTERKLSVGKLGVEGSSLVSSWPVWCLNLNITTNKLQHGCAIPPLWLGSTQLITTEHAVTAVLGCAIRLLLLLLLLLLLVSCGHDGGSQTLGSSSST